jgi:hypothetical protein
MAHILRKKYGSLRPRWRTSVKATAVKKEDADEFADDELPVLAPDLLRAPYFCDFSFPFLRKGQRYEFLDKTNIIYPHPLYIIINGQMRCLYAYLQTKRGCFLNFCGPKTDRPGRFDPATLISETTPLEKKNAPRGPARARKRTESESK